MAAAYVSAVAQLKREGFKPSRDIVLAFTSDEELGAGPTNGMLWLINNQRPLIDAEFAINEGGFGLLVNGKAQQNQIQTSEKVIAYYQLEIRDPGGHSSRPTKSNPIHKLSEALARLAAYDFPVMLNDGTRAWYERSAQFESGQRAADMRAGAQNPPDPGAVARLSVDPYHNALLRTTCAATQIEGGHARNALPQVARATVNCRILPNHPRADVEKTLKEVINNDQISVKLLLKAWESPPSPLHPDLFGVAEKLTQAMWPGVPVVPAMGTGATDSRYVRNVGIPVYGVSGLFLDTNDVRAHGRDERAGVKEMYEFREFMYRFIKAVAQ